MKKISVSIGIPAFNEQENIKNLLESILIQKEVAFELVEIIVISDGSTDKTTREVKILDNKKINIFENKTRLGLAAGQNKIVKLFKGDLLILFNADVLPAGSNFIEELIRPFKNKKVALVGPKITPLKAKTFFEQILNYSVEFKDSMAESWRNGNNLYLCRGAARAFSREFAKKIRWGDSLSEDAFSYLMCLKEGYEFHYEPAAILYFKSPDNFLDHLMQSARFVSGPSVMMKYFNASLVKKEYMLPKRIAIREMARFLLKNPVLFSLYLLIFSLIKLVPNKGRYASTNWKVSSSSKNLAK